MAAWWGVPQTGNGSKDTWRRTSWRGPWSSREVFWHYSCNLVLRRNLEMELVTRPNAQSLRPTPGNFQHIFGRGCGLIQRAAPGGDAGRCIVLNIDNVAVGSDKQHVERDQRVNDPAGTWGH